MLADPLPCRARKDHLIAEARLTLAQPSRNLAEPDTTDPLTDPRVLGKAVRLGILDAPHLRGSKIARGEIKTRIIQGGCEAVRPDGSPFARLNAFPLYL